MSAVLASRQQSLVFPLTAPNRFGCANVTTTY
jgi:hypothetical protein